MDGEIDKQYTIYFNGAPFLTYVWVVGDVLQAWYFSHDNTMVVYFRGGEMRILYTLLYICPVSRFYLQLGYNVPVGK